MTSVVYPTLTLANVWLPALALLATSLAAGHSIRHGVRRLRPEADYKG